MPISIAAAAACAPTPQSGSSEERANLSDVRAREAAAVRWNERSSEPCGTLPKLRYIRGRPGRGLSRSENTRFGLGLRDDSHPLASHTIERNLCRFFGLRQGLAEDQPQGGQPLAMTGLAGQNKQEAPRGQRFLRRWLVGDGSRGSLSLLAARSAAGVALGRHACRPHRLQGVGGRRDAIFLGPGQLLGGRHAATASPAGLGARAAAAMVHAGKGLAEILDRFDPDRQTEGSAEQRQHQERGNCLSRVSFRFFSEPNKKSHRAAFVKVGQKVRLAPQEQA